MYWELHATYEDGTEIDEVRDYNENKTTREQEYELECELIEENSYSFVASTFYSVALITE